MSRTSPVAAATRVRTTTRAASAGAELIAALPSPTGSASFVRDGDGLVGTGVFARTTVHGPDAAGQIARWWAEVSAGLEVRDEIGLPGTGPVVFVSLGFGDDDASVAVVPSVVHGRRDGTAFTTTLGSPGATPVRPVTTPGRVTYSDAFLSVGGFTGAVARATDRIHAGELDKVVLAHDLLATAQFPVDERFLLRQLARSYPTCWTFAVDGLVGASPEMLVRRTGRVVESRVLAGTAWRDEHGQGEAAIEAGLLASEKDLAEHRFAARSVADTLAPWCVELAVPDRPHPLKLANLTHLATDIRGTLDDRAPTALEVAALLHPTAAVGGSPRAEALALIRELEPHARERYAAPVGWMDSTGDGEFAIALRCAQVDGREVRLMAGCGIVAGSDPEIEAREAQIKMLPIRDALESRA
nr:isochorismate synthase [Nakamurella flavida]